MFNKHHPDFNGLYVLSTILGGYFGSRLMANIREDKGYTYNIYATLDAMLFDGYFCIGTEVGNELVEPTIKEIHHEMKLLREELVSTEELEMLRNYLMGNFLAMLDGPFNISELLRTMLIEDLPFSSFEQMIETVNTIQPEQLRDLACKYLNPDNMWEVVVGGGQ
jgi:predicted Zn-dependent peptidase